MLLKNFLSQNITTKPDVIQFAKDRKFEEAWIIPFDNVVPTEEIINQYLAKEPYQVLIVEYIWDSKRDEKRFVLTVFKDGTCKLKNDFEFMNICLNQFFNYQGFDKLIDTLNQKIVGSEAILNLPLEAINLGIFNYWLSTRPIDIWEMGEEYNKDDMLSKLQARPEIINTNLNYQGLQFRFNLKGDFPGPYYGFKTPCCHKVDGVWKVDFEVVDYWITLLLGNIDQ
ncbi:hypothetical protein KBD45_04085 [Candidatus Dojkabacteria bacterium]|nr:hypothetical protein [Candidatus Dojkabacteria bacterium]